MTREERAYSFLDKINPFKKKSKFSPELTKKVKAHLSQSRDRKLNNIKKDSKALSTPSWSGNSHAKAMAGVRANYHNKTGKFSGV